LTCLLGLKEFNLYDNGLEECPPIDSSTLEKLNFDGNKLRKVSIPVAPALVELRAAENELSELPENIDRLTHLKSLILFRNRLKQLPRLHLSELKELILWDNQLEDLPELQTPQLQILNLAHNRFTQVPAALASLFHLQRLDLRNNPLKEAGIYEGEALQRVQERLRKQILAQKRDSC
jgi:Leucine-rich repeat (LRR) protein